MVLNQMFDRLQGAFERQARFTADASHELRTPVRVRVVPFRIGLGQGSFARRVQRVARGLLSCVETNEGFGRRSAHLGRSRFGTTGSATRTVDFRHRCKSALSLLQPLAEQRQIELASELQPVEIRGDVERLGQVVTNLISNAIAYNRDGGKVRITLAPQEANAVSTVSDTGIGIEAADLPKIFDRFYCVDKSRSGSRGGNGLGLAICREIVRSHGGTIEASSVAGEGSTFTVRLPTGT